MSTEQLFYKKRLPVAIFASANKTVKYGNIKRKVDKEDAKGSR